MYEQTVGPEILKQRAVSASERHWHRSTAVAPRRKRVLQRALAILEKRPEPDHPDIASVLEELGLIAMAQDDLREGRTISAASPEPMRNSLGREPSRIRSQP